jgi:hypothetical protein
MARCTGAATSTFGGGGGTKLFCSQALNATHANIAKQAGKIAVACPALPFGLMNAGERVGFISLPNLLRQRKVLFDGKNCVIHQ